jgi:hypothetical protein
VRQVSRLEEKEEEMREIQEMSIMIISFLFFVALSKAELFFIFLESEPIGAFDKIPVGTPHHNKPNGASSYAIQLWELLARDLDFEMILNILVYILLNFSINLINYVRFRRVSKKQEETKQELRMMIQTCKSLMLELRSKRVFMQKLVERHAQSQEMDLLMKMEDEQAQLLKEVDSLTRVTNAKDECRVQVPERAKWQRKKTAGYPGTRESPVKKNCSVASKIPRLQPRRKSQ